MKKLRFVGYEESKDLSKKEKEDRVSKVYDLLFKKIFNNKKL